MHIKTRGNVTGFKIAVDEVARVDILHATELDTAEVSKVTILEADFTDQLAGEEQDSFQSELIMVLNKEVVKGWAEAFGHHRIKARFHTKPKSTRDTGAVVKLPINLKLVVERTGFPSHLFEFNNDVLP